MWAWLKEKVGWTTRKEMEGETLRSEEFWEISAPRNNAKFIRSLKHLFPSGASLCLEGAGVSRKVASFSDAREPQEKLKIARGTIWPKSRVFYVCLDDESLKGLAKLFERHAAPEICCHLHANRNGRVLLQWYDAFSHDPLLVSGDIAESCVSAFSNSLGCEYRKYRAGPYRGPLTSQQ
jgi:hypothetical protein